MKISIPFFKGEVPRQSSRLLPDGFAAEAVNARLKTGDLTPWREPSTLFTLSPSGIRTIYKMQTNNIMLRWPDTVHVARGPVAGDTTERLYFTGAKDYADGSASGNRPKVTNYAMATGGTVHTNNTAGNYPNNWLLLGVPAPTGAPTATPSAPSDSDNVQFTTYVYTWINNLGEESAPSPASALITFTDGDTTTLTGIADPTATQIIDYGLDNTGSGTKRLYRAATAASGETQYLFVKDIDYNITSTTDSFTDSQLGEVLETADWNVPPADGHSILALPNGITVMASKNQIFPSVQNRPHAYPRDFALTTDFPIVGLGAIDTTIVVLTEANPYIVVGSDPSAMSMAKLELPYGCVSRRSIAHLKGFGVIYASANGLISINGAGGINQISDPYFTRKQWQALNPSTIFGFTHDDRYFFFYDVQG